jgi:hypothetical protein
MTADEMFLHALAKVVFVIPLDFRHFQEALNQIGAAASARISRCGFILANVSALETAGAIHRRQPTRHVTKESEHSSDPVRALFAELIRPALQGPEHFPNLPAMTPFIVLNILNCGFLLGVTDRLPVPTIRVCCGQLA